MPEFSAYLYFNQAIFCKIDWINWQKDGLDSESSEDVVVENCIGSQRERVGAWSVYNLHKVTCQIKLWTITMADLGFPRDGDSNREGVGLGGGGSDGANTPKFPKTAWNWKNLGTHQWIRK